MKKLIEFLRFLFIGFEFVVILCALVIFKLFSEHVIAVSDLISAKSDVIKHISLIPSGITAWVFIKGKSLLFPEKDKKEIFQNWPDYWKLKIGFEVSLLYSSLFSLAGLIGWAFDWKSSDPLPLIMMVTSLMGSVIVFYTVYKAQITINELFIKQNDG